MTDNQVVAPYKVAVIINGEVVDTVTCDLHSWSFYTSNPTFVDITDNPGMLAIGDKYNG